MRRLALALAPLIVAFAVAFASTTFAQAPRAGGQLVHGSVQEPGRIWRPVTGLTVSGEIGQLVNGHLIEINERLEYVPSLASDVPTIDNGGVSKDGLRYTFKLRHGVKWHDGQPFTAADVAFTHCVLLNPAMDVRGRVGWNKTYTRFNLGNHTAVAPASTTSARPLAPSATLTPNSDASAPI
jgi:ABC-type transport system substrate-binding protein